MPGRPPDRLASIFVYSDSVPGAVAGLVRVTVAVPIRRTCRA